MNGSISRQALPWLTVLALWSAGCNDGINYNSDIQTSVEDTCEATNACGGCGRLEASLGEVCGVCDTGRVACFGEEETFCQGERQDSINGCGGCGVLEQDPGSACGLCAGGQVTCDGPDTTTCNNAGQLVNACGGCDPLRGELRAACGQCGDGALRCDGPNALTCEGASTPNVCGGCEPGPEHLNACGGCDPLSGEVDGACGTCDMGVLVCDGEEALRCDGDLGQDALNPCGGCRPLDAHGSACGQCGSMVCDGLEALRCAEDTLPCNLREAIEAWRAAILERLSNLDFHRLLMLCDMSLFAALQTHDIAQFGTMFLQLRMAASFAADAEEHGPYFSTEAEASRTLDLALAWQISRVEGDIDRLGLNTHFEEALRKITEAVLDDIVAESFAALTDSVLWQKVALRTTSVSNEAEAALVFEILAQEIRAYALHEPVLDAPLYAVQVLQRVLDDLVAIQTTLDLLADFGRTALTDAEHARFIETLGALFRGLRSPPPIEVRLWQVQIEAVMSFLVDRYFVNARLLLGPNHPVENLVQHHLEAASTALDEHGEVPSFASMLAVECATLATYNLLYHPPLPIQDHCCADLRRFHELDANYSIPENCQ